MGMLLRSAVVIGAIVYLSPIRNAPPEEMSPVRQQPVTAAAANAADALWKALPESARKTVTDETKRRVLDEVRNNLLPDTSGINGEEGKTRPIPSSANNSARHRP